MMTLTFLKTFLKKFGSFYIDTYNMRNELVNSHELISSMWFDDFKNAHPDMYPIRFNNEFVTYENCMQFKFELQNGKAVCVATVWNGHIMDGRPIDKRCQLTFRLKSVTHRIEKMVEYIIMEKAKYIIEQEDQAAKTLRIYNAYENLMLKIEENK